MRLKAAVARLARSDMYGQDPWQYSIIACMEQLVDYDGPVDSMTETPPDTRVLYAAATTAIADESPAPPEWRTLLVHEWGIDRVHEHTRRRALADIAARDRAVAWWVRSAFRLPADAAVTEQTFAPFVFDSECTRLRALDDDDGDPWWADDDEPICRDYVVRRAAAMRRRTKPTSAVLLKWGRVCGRHRLRRLASPGIRGMPARRHPASPRLQHRHARCRL